MSDLSPQSHETDLLDDLPAERQWLVHHRLRPQDGRRRAKGGKKGDETKSDTKSTGATGDGGASDSGTSESTPKVSDKSATKKSEKTAVA